MTQNRAEAPALHAIVLAAGQGTRMKSALPKVLHPLAGRPLLAHVLDGLGELAPAAIHIVHGHGGEQVRAWLQAEQPKADIQWAQQTEQKGTAHAVSQAVPGIPDAAVVLIGYGDVPLTPVEDLKALAATGKDALAILTAQVDQAHGYGRIVRGEDGTVVAIVEENDASDEQRRITEINTGLMAMPASRLKAWLDRIGNDNAKGEYYLTDVVALAVSDGVMVRAVKAQDAARVEGVNDKRQLARAERLYQRWCADRLMQDGVGFADPDRFDCRGRLQCGSDVRIDVGVIVEGDVVLGDGVSVGPHTVLKNAHVASGTQIESHCVIEGARIGRDCRLGPFARIRPDSELADEARVGNFVELKKTRLGAGSKANHLAYLGDAQVGAGVNIGAGVITCNYDGANKFPTQIGDGAFIGTDTQLIAPLKIGPGAYIAAGSTIASDAPADSLTICRARGQKSYPGWKRPQKRRG